MLTDLHFLQQKGMSFRFIAVTKPNLNVVNMASLATMMPIHHSSIGSTGNFVNLCYLPWSHVNESIKKKKILNFFMNLISEL